MAGRTLVAMGARVHAEGLDPAGNLTLWKRSRPLVNMMSAPADVSHRTFDDIALHIDDEAQPAPSVKEGQANLPRVVIEATLAHARESSFAHQRLNERRLNREPRGDDCRINSDRALLPQRISRN